MGLLHPGAWKGRWIGLSSGSSAWFTRSQWIWYPEGNPALSAPLGVRVFRRQIAVPAERPLTQMSCYDYCLQLMASYASVIGKTEEARQYRAKAVQMRTVFNARFLHSAPDFYGNDSAISNIFPLALGFVPADQRSRVVDALVRKLEYSLPADKSAGVTFRRQEPGAAVYRVGSGEYRFTSELPR